MFLAPCWCDILAPLSLTAGRSVQKHFQKSSFLGVRDLFRGIMYFDGERTGSGKEIGAGEVR
jgi:hypothetical protein